MTCFAAGLLFIIPNAIAQENKAEGKLLENDMIEGAAERVDNADISIDTYQENLPSCFKIQLILIKQDISNYATVIYSAKFKYAIY